MGRTTKFTYSTSALQAVYTMLHLCVRAASALPNIGFSHRGSLFIVHTGISEAVSTRDTKPKKHCLQVAVTFNFLRIYANAFGECIATCRQDACQCFVGLVPPICIMSHASWYHSHFQSR